MNIRSTFLAALAAVGLVGSLGAQIRITEWMYNGSEFVEFTNVGTTDIDMTGWSFSDSGTGAGTVDLSAFGVVVSGQSVILSEASAAGFKTLWGLGASVVVIGGNVTNLSRGDTINLWNASNTLVDTLDYADNGDAGGPRTNGTSAWTELANLGKNDATLWTLSSVGDALGSWTSLTGGFIANPGSYFAAVPEPSTYASIAALLALGFAIRRRRASKA